MLRKTRKRVKLRTIRQPLRTYIAAATKRRSCKQEKSCGTTAFSIMPNKLTNSDYCQAAKKLKCEVAAIKSVASVESAGDGFLPSGKVKILFERHHFSRLTKRVYDNDYPQISNRAAGGYYGNEKEYQRFNIAFELNPSAAMKSCSWGKFQIMGFNHAVCGFATVNEFVEVMKQGEGGQLQAFCGFVETNKLADELRRLDWAGFAKGYNGSAYKINKYDTKMATAYTKFAKENINCNGQVSPKIPSQEAAIDDNVTPSNPPEPTREEFSADGNEAGGSWKESEKVETPQPSVISVPQVSAEPSEAKPETGIKASLAGAVTFLTTFGAGIFSLFSGVKSELIYGFFGASALVGIVFIWKRFDYAAKKEQREFEEKQDREKRAFELQKLTLESAMRKDLNTVVIKPTPILNSDDPTKVEAE